MRLLRRILIAAALPLAALLLTTVFSPADPPAASAANREAPAAKVQPASHRTGDAGSWVHAFMTCSRD